MLAVYGNREHAMLSPKITISMSRRSTCVVDCAVKAGAKLTISLPRFFWATTTAKSRTFGHKRSIASLHAT